MRPDSLNSTVFNSTSTPAIDPFLTVELVRACAMAPRDYYHMYSNPVLRIVALDPANNKNNTYMSPGQLLYEKALTTGYITAGTKISIPVKIGDGIDPAKHVVVRVCEGGTTKCLQSTGRWPNEIKLSANQTFPINVYQKQVKTRNLNDEPLCDNIHSSPLVLDLDDDGINLSGLQNGVWFDLDGDGKQELTGWTLSGRDAFLTIDLMANGYVDNGKELFGNASSLDGEILADNGFEALRKYDSNGDYLITNHDTIFNSLRLWMDHNRNGQSESSELVSLVEEDINTIFLDYHTMLEIDAHGNQTRQRSHFLKSSNRFYRIVDIWFNWLP